MLKSKKTAPVPMYTHRRPIASLRGDSRKGPIPSPKTKADTGSTATTSLVTPRSSASSSIAGAMMDEASGDKKPDHEMQATCAHFFRSCHSKGFCVGGSSISPLLPSPSFR